MIARRRLLALAACVGSRAWAQTAATAVTPDRVRALLESPEISERAWGAYHAGAVGLVELQPLLAERLRETVRSFGTEGGSRLGGHYAHILADSVIRLGQAVPMETLRALVDARLDVWALILLRFSLDSDGNEELLLTMLDRRPKKGEGDVTVWTAIGNNLLRLRSSRWAVRLMVEVEVRHLIVVVDGGYYGRGGGVGGGAWGSSGRGVWPKDFPPQAVHYLTFKSAAGGDLIAPGPQNVYAVREEIHLHKPGIGSSAFSGSFGPGQKPRLAYLAALASVNAGDLQSLFERTTELHWKDAAQFDLDLEREVARQIAEIRQFARSLADMGITGLDGIKFQVLIEMEDGRRSRTPDLPTVEPRVFTLP